MRRIQSVFGVKCCLSTVYNILRRGRLTKQRPTELYGKCDDKMKVDFKKKSVQ